MASYGKMKYRYNPSGSRIGKSDGDTRTAYYLDGTRLVREETISDSNRPYVPGALESIDYHYDGHGTLASLSMKCYNRSVAEYYYLRNTLGDVVALCDAVGNIVAAYEYDAWGGVHGVYDGFGVNRINEQDFVGNLNPIRYRGYYYDTETALYYLQSRYFDPGTGRFVNADSVIDSGHSLFGHNLYAYGNNNPVVYVDPSGCIPLLVITGLVGLLGGAIIGGCIAASKGESVLAGALVGGAVGGLIGVGAGALAGGLLGGSVLASGAAVVAGAGAATQPYLQQASRAAFVASEKINNFTISSKHLMDAGGRYAKFNTNSPQQVRQIVQETLCSPNAVFLPNGDSADSFRVFTDVGYQIGTKGQTIVKVIVKEGGKIITGYPVITIK